MQFHELASDSALVLGIAMGSRRVGSQPSRANKIPWILVKGHIPIDRVAGDEMRMAPRWARKSFRLVGNSHDSAVCRRTAPSNSFFWIPIVIWISPLSLLWFINRYYLLSTEYGYGAHRCTLQGPGADLGFQALCVYSLAPTSPRPLSSYSTGCLYSPNEKDYSGHPCLAHPRCPPDASEPSVAIWVPTSSSSGRPKTYLLKPINCTHPYVFCLPDHLFVV